jgi:hypothetical protein
LELRVYQFTLPLVLHLPISAILLKITKIETIEIYGSL